MLFNCIDENFSQLWTCQVDERHDLKLLNGDKPKEAIFNLFSDLTYLGVTGFR